jgi:hypothetical protein
LGVDAGGEWEAGVVKGGVALEVDTAEGWLVGEEARSEEKGQALWVSKEIGDRRRGGVVLVGWRNR